MSSKATEVIDLSGSPDEAIRSAVTLVGEVNTHLRRSAANRFQAGVRLRDAKAKVPHGLWSRCFRDSKDPLPETFDLSQEDAQRLMRIAGNPTLGKTGNFPFLPWADSTLDELQALEPEVLQGAIERREVTPELKCDEAKQLVRKLKEEPATKEKAEPATATQTDQAWNAEAEKELLADRIFAAVKPWIAACRFEDLSYAETALRQVADYLQEGRESSESLTQAGHDFLSTAKSELEALLARKDAEEKGQPSLVKVQLAEYVNKLVDDPTYGSVKPVEMVRVIERVIEGRICGHLEQKLLVRAIELKGPLNQYPLKRPVITPKADTVKKVTARR
jgi:hypothetical protein